MSANSTGTINIGDGACFDESSGNIVAKKDSGVHYQGSSSSPLGKDQLVLTVSHTHNFTPQGTISDGSYKFKGKENSFTNTTGKGTSFSIMPPYITKYVWERIA